MQTYNEYLSRVNKVLDYIDNNIGENLSLDELSKVACFSKFHFHRIFYSVIGETLFDYIQRIRIEKSAGMLLTNLEFTITEIALKCGFTSSAIFSRVFKDYFNLTPSEWKKTKKIFFNENDLKQSIKNKKNEIVDFSQYIEIKPDSIIWNINNNNKNYFVEVKNITDLTVAYVRYIGAYKENISLFENLYNKLLKWAIPRNLINQESLYINIYHDTPEITDENKLRLSVCINIPENTEVQGEIGKMILPGGKYAFSRFHLGENDYQEAWDWVFCKWLPQSGYQPDDRSCFEIIRGKNPSDEKHIVDICIPVKPL